MPLNKAVCVGDRLRCHYHGLEFEPDGTCVHVPGQSMVPPGAAVKAYPVVERYNWMWIWMGDPAIADEDKITPYPWRESEDWGDKGTYFHVQCNSQLIIDNPWLCLQVGMAAVSTELRRFECAQTCRRTPKILTRGRSRQHVQISRGMRPCGQFLHPHTPRWDSKPRGHTTCLCASFGCWARVVLDLAVGSRH